MENGEGFQGESLNNRIGLKLRVGNYFITPCLCMLTSRREGVREAKFVVFVEIRVSD